MSKINNSKLILGNCLDVMKNFESNIIDLTVTSPPYDELRNYNGNNNIWCKDVWERIIEELYRIMKPGGVVVWVVGDATIDGSETLSSCYQKIHFKEVGFKIHDTMIYEKNSSTFPAKKGSNRYTQVFEFMFIFSKGNPFSNLLCDKKNKYAGRTSWGQRTNYDKEGNLKKAGHKKETPEFSYRNNIWKYSTGFNDKTDHPAVFPEKLAHDHILSWSKPGHLVFDPFTGSGTTGKMAKLLKRDFVGIELDEKYFKIAEKRINKILVVPNEIDWGEE